mmetsp:Transcript_8717/g.15883  ORF Transcript_8717/g.15883 Transcript_8717/m.15883 type:complete len:239 (+) Transcript_8717:147-863(+)
MRWIIPQDSNNPGTSVTGRYSLAKENSVANTAVKNHKADLLSSSAKKTWRDGSKTVQKGLSFRSLQDQVPDGGACNLVYELDSSGRLVEHYSMRPLSGATAVGRWTAGPSKKIAPFKFKRNAGRNVLIGNCSAGVQGRKNYCSGWCQFVKSAKILRGDVTVYDIPTGFKAMPVDVYMYYDDNRPGHQSVKLIPGKPYTTDNLLAVACVPKNTQFYENMTVDLLKWLQDGNNIGYSTKI